jgi:hypothetical protein
MWSSCLVTTCECQGKGGGRGGGHGTAGGGGVVCLTTGGVLRGRQGDAIESVARAQMGGWGGRGT